VKSYPIAQLQSWCTTHYRLSAAAYSIFPQLASMSVGCLYLQSDDASRCDDKGQVTQYFSEVVKSKI